MAMVMAMAMAMAMVMVVVMAVMVMVVMVMGFRVSVCAGYDAQSMSKNYMQHSAVKNAALNPCESPLTVQCVDNV